MNNKIYICAFIFVLVASVLSGCLDFLPSNQIFVYESHPTEITYTVTYGYKINCIGQGKYLINCSLDIPEVLDGRILSTDIHDDNYQSVNYASNNMIRWDFNSSENIEYEFLLTAEVKAESYVITDLNGPDGLTIEQINKQYPSIVKQFCNTQSNETTIFINPFDSVIAETSSKLYTNVKTNNSFLVAKELFKWLKQHTTYKAHELDDDKIQSAHTTFLRKTGDCDDLSFLYISLCRSLHIPARFIRGFLLDENCIIQHVWVEVFVGGGICRNGWIPVECSGTSNDAETEINQNFGIENAEHLRLFIDDGSNESLNISFSGLTYRIFSESREINVEFYTNVTNYLISKSKQLIVDKNKIRSYS